MPRRCLLVPLLLASCAHAQFTRLNSNTTESLRGLSTPSSRVAWASGTHGTYIRTTDGGETWIASQVPGAEALDFRDVEAFSADTAFLLSAGPGDQSRIYKTTDGGKTWILQFTNRDPKGFLDCMAFWDHGHGIVVGDPVGGKFVLISTDNGGKTWTPIPTEKLPPALDGEGAFAASGSCIAVEGTKNVWFVTGGKVARVFRSTDRGHSWSVADTPIVHSNESSGIFSVAFLNSKDGFIAGGDYKNPAQGEHNLAVTTDGGLSWKGWSISPGSFFSALAPDPVSSSSFLLVGSEKAAYTRDISSKKWSVFSDQSLNAVSFYGPGKAYAVGPKGTVVRFVRDPGR